MRCCFRIKNSRNRNRGDGATAVNEEYMEWHAPNRVNGSRHSLAVVKSEENIYVDPDEVPQSIRFRPSLEHHQQLPPPPPASMPTRLPPAPPDDDGEYYGGDPRYCAYAILDIDSLSKPMAPVSEQPTNTTAAATAAGAAAAATATETAEGSQASQTLDRSAAIIVQDDERLNPIYSDIIGVLKQ